MAFDLSGKSRGIASMIASMMLFISNDALVKHVSESLPTTQIIFLRGLSASPRGVAAAAWVAGWWSGPVRLLIGVAGDVGVARAGRRAEEAAGGMAGVARASGA